MIREITLEEAIRVLRANIAGQTVYLGAIIPAESKILEELELLQKKVVLLEDQLTEKRWKRRDPLAEL